MTCAYCGDMFAPASTGRPPRFCGGACRVAAHRKRGRAVLALEDLAARLNALLSLSLTADDADRLLAGLEPGYVERRAGGWTLGPAGAPAAVEIRDAFSLIADGNVPLESGDVEGPTRLSPGPRPGSRRRELEEVA